MATYNCFFDASYTPIRKRGAFHIENGNDIIKQSVVKLSANTPDMAEAEALHKLLDHIKVNIKPGSRVQIYGDALFIIQSILRGDKCSKRYKNVKDKYELLCKYYDLSIDFIPGKKNKNAHKLAKYGMTA